MLAVVIVEIGAAPDLPMFAQQLVGEADEMARQRRFVGEELARECERVQQQSGESRCEIE